MNCFEHFDYTSDKTGLTYRVEKHFDDDTSPLDMDEGIVVEDFGWDVCDDDAVQEYIEHRDPDMRYVATLLRMKPLHSRHSPRPARYRAFDTVATENALIKQGVKQADVLMAAEKLYDWYNGWLREEWYYVTLWVLPLDEHGEPIKGEHAHCLSGIESTEEVVLSSRHWNDYIEDLIDEVFWSQRRETHKGQLELNFN